MFNNEQKQAIEYDGDAKNLLVLAGAGTGKTTTMIQRVVYLIQNGVEAHEIILLTFTNRAAKEMKMRLKRELGSVADDIFAGNFHQLCRSIMQRMPKSFGIEQISIIDSDEQGNLMSKSRSNVVKHLDRDVAKEFPKKNTLLEIKSFATNTCVSYEDYILNGDKYSFGRDTVDLMLSAFDGYTKGKERSNYMDFDDLLSRFNYNLKNNEDLRARIQAAFSHILVDEFQDTNVLQYELLRNISSEDTNLFCVGDDAQSIYCWRGARFETINKFDTYFDNSKVIKLVQNYRSTQEILDVSNWLLRKSPVDYDKELVAFKGKMGIKPIFSSFDDEYAEAEFICDKIIDRYNSGYKYKDVAIIVPTAFSSRAVESELIRRKIPYIFIGGSSVSKAAHVKDVLSLVRVIDNPKDELAWFRLLCLFPRIGEATANRLINEMLKHTEPSDMLRVLEDKFTASSLVYRAVSEGFSDMSRINVIVRNCCNSMSPVLKDKYDRWASRSKDLTTLEKTSERYSGLTGFLQDLVLEPMHNTELEKDEVDDTITLITVHSAKGTEYPITFVSSVNPGLYPNLRTFGDEEAEEEQRRVLYVALTRAMDELFVTRTLSFKNTSILSSATSIGESYLFSDVPYEIFYEPKKKPLLKAKKGFLSLSD